MTHSDPSSVVRDPIRVAAVRATGLLNTAPEESTDRLTRLAVRLLEVPVALPKPLDVEQFLAAVDTMLLDPVTSLT